MTSYIHPVIHGGDKIIIFDRLHISVSYLQFCKMVVTSTYPYFTQSCDILIYHQLLDS